MIKKIEYKKPNIACVVGGLIYAYSYNQIGNAYANLGELKKTLDYHEKALAIRLQIYGDAHPDVATSYSNIGNAYMSPWERQKKGLATMKKR